MQTEYAALMKNVAWTFVPPPSHGNIRGCKYVFKIKHKPDGIIERFKSCLVATGFNQTPDIDYFEIFSPVVKPSTIRSSLLPFSSLGL